MRRRVLFIAFFAIVAVLTFTYFRGNTVVPELTFAQAAKVGDTKKKVIVTGVVEPNQVTAEEGTLTFWMHDSAGVVSKVYYDGPDRITSDEITTIRAEKKMISVSGHVCGDRFHTSGITFH